jgi:hypothetical protein
MPRNTTGGSGHKSQKNSEGNKARDNRLKGDALLDDIMDEVSTAVDEYTAMEVYQYAKQ